MTNHPSKEAFSLASDVSKIFQTPYFLDWGRRTYNAKPGASIAGDCFLLPYRNHNSRVEHYDYILVDAGLAATFNLHVISTALNALATINPNGVITGIIITHIDEDHCGGLNPAHSAWLSDKFQESIYGNVQWIAVGMTYLEKFETEVSALWRGLERDFEREDEEFWNMQRVHVPKSSTAPTPAEYKKHMDNISKEIFCRTNGQVLARCWKLLKDKPDDTTVTFNESMHFYLKRGSSMIKSELVTQNITHNRIMATGTDIDDIDNSHKNKSSITTLYCSYQEPYSQDAPRYYCFNGDSIVSFSHLLTYGLPHNHKFATELFKGLINYPYYQLDFIPVPDPIKAHVEKLKGVYETVFTLDIHYEFQSMIEATDNAPDKDMQANLSAAMDKALVPINKKDLVTEYITNFKNAQKTLNDEQKTLIKKSVNKWDAVNTLHIF